MGTSLASILTNSPLILLKILLKVIPFIIYKETLVAIVDFLNFAQQKILTKLSRV